MSRKPRKYYPIWEKLRAFGVVEVTYSGDPKIRKRLVKAVIKEKDLDVELKEVSPKRLWASDISSSQIRFQLQEVVEK